MAIAAVRNQLKTLDIEKAQNYQIKRSKSKTNTGGTYMKTNQDKWILDADIKGFFDNINHK